MREKFFSILFHNLFERLEGEMKWGATKESPHERYSRFQVGVFVQRVLVGVVYNRVIQQILHTEPPSDQSSRQSRRNVVRHPVCHDVDVPPVPAQQV